MKELKIKSDQERIFFTTVKITNIKKNGKSTIGTGSFFEYKIESGDMLGKYSIFLVTNKHVIENASELKLSFNKRIDKDTIRFGNKFSINLKDFNFEWFKHPNKDIDLAIYPFTPVLKSLRKKKGEDQLPFIQNIVKRITLINKYENINPIEDVFFIGYPRDIYDKKNNIPLIRKGITATPIMINYMERPVFLIDGAIFPGSSGSPVFICNDGGYTLNGKLYMGIRTIFLGVLSTGFKNIDGQIWNKNKPYMDLGVVIKAEVILDLIERYLKQNRITS
ncbi:MAG: serine protease [Candidatus Hermodarchaeota archaeon]